MQKITGRGPATPSLQQVVQYLEANPHLLAQQRPMYTPEKIMMLLEHHNLDLLKSEFESHGTVGITLKSFLWIMTHTIEHRPQGRLELLYSLMRLFKQIDIDGNEHLDWTEFITYIIEAVKEERSRMENISEGESDKQILQNAYAGESRSYRVSERIKDITSDRGSPIKQVEFIERFNLILCLDDERDFIRMYGGDDLKERINERIYIKTGGQQYIVSYAFGDDTLIVVGSLKDIIFYSTQRQHFEYTGKSSVLSQPTSVWYLPIHKMFITCDCEFKVRQIRKPPRRRDEKLPQSIGFKAHDSSITCVKELKSPMCVVTSSMDGSIKLWDFTNKKRLIIELRDPTQTSIVRGVKGFDVGYSNTIVSWGFQSYLNVWAPDYSIVRPYSGQLKSIGMIIDARCVYGSTIVISLDNKNTVRVWDQRRMLCLQSFVMQSANLGLLVSRQGFIVYGRKMTLFEMAKDMNTQEESRKLNSLPKDVYFNFFYGILIILTPTQLRVHNAKTGQLKAVHSMIFESAHDNYLTSFIRGSDRKLYLGNSEGSVNLINIRSGATLKNVHVANRQDTRINKMFFFKEEHILVTASERLQSFDELLLEDAIVKTIQINEVEEVSELCFSEELLLFITVSTSKFIVWSFESFKLLYAQEIQEQITAVHFLPGLFALAILTQKSIQIYSMDSTFLNFKLVCQINNLELEKPQILTTMQSIQIQIPQQPNVANIYEQLLKNNNITEDSLTTYEQSLLEAAKSTALTNDRLLLVVGNSIGYLYRLDITPIVYQAQLTPIINRRKIKFFEFKRREHQMFRLTALYEMPLKPMGIVDHIQVVASINKIHKQSVTSIANISNINAFCTCSLDSTVKIFSCITGELFGSLQLNTLKIDCWKLPSRIWINERLQEFSMVLSLSGELSGQNLSEAELDQARARFLMNLFMNKEQKQIFVRNLYTPVNHEKQPQKVEEKPVVKVESLRQSIRREKIELEQSMKTKYKSFSVTKNSFKEQSKKIIETPASVPNNKTESSKNIIRMRSNTHLAKKLGYDSRPILSMNKNGFVHNLRHIQHIVAESRSPIINNNPKKQLIKNTMYRQGEGQRLLKSATRMTIDNFYSNSQLKPNMELQLFERMNRMFKTLTDTSPKKKK